MEAKVAKKVHSSKSSRSVFCFKGQGWEREDLLQGKQESSAEL